MTEYYFPRLAAHEAECCVSKRDDIGRLPIGFCGPDCLRRPVPLAGPTPPASPPVAPVPPPPRRPPKATPGGPESPRLLSCGECSQKFSSQTRLDDHVRIWHLTPRPRRS